MTSIRRLDHIAIAVADTERALRRFRDQLGLHVVHQEDLEQPPVRLTYLDAGNAYLQLVQPLDDASSLACWLREHGEGLHHVCFGADDAVAAAAEMGAGEARPGQGRGRPSAFVPGDPSHGVIVEFTEFRRDEDVEHTAGWLPGR